MSSEKDRSTASRSSSSNAQSPAASPRRPTPSPKHPTPRQALGALGERLAAERLRRSGYTILEANYRCPVGEIDIVARRGSWLVFVEVRTRRGQGFGTPEESITAAKAQKLRDLAAFYLDVHPEAPADWRIDVAAVELSADGQLVRLDILEHAVESG